MDRRNFINGTLLGLGGMVASPAWPTAKLQPTADPVSTKSGLLETARAILQQHQSSLLHTDIVGIADYSLHSAKQRFHLIDMEGGEIASFLVAHGKGSDRKHTGWLKEFSNVPGSEASSGGAYVTTETYTGKHGLSRRLGGLEPSNDMAEARAIVIHGAWYAEPKMVKAHGKLGRSQGCFAFSETDLDQILERLGSGRLLYASKG